MTKHSSQPHNLNIDHVYYLAGFIESRGRGMEKYVIPAVKRIFLSEHDITGNSIMIRFIALVCWPHYIR